MGRGSFQMIDGSSSKKGCPYWQVAVLCSLLVAIGLGVGLGVGLSNQKTVIVQEPQTSTTPGVIQSTTTPTGGSTTTPSQAPATTSSKGSTTTQTTTTVIPSSGPWTNYMLPTYIIPSHYALMLHPNMSTDTYIGSNAMTIHILQPTKYILVHVDALLNITSTKLQDKRSQDVTIAREFRYPDYEYYVIEADDTLPVDDGYVLTMEFEGSLVGRIVGLYKSVYTTPEGVEKAMVGSDMEPTDARKAYPCFDEPALKIKYTTSLVHEIQHTALSNMDVEENITRDDGLIETIFRESVKMSTYLACFAISDFTYIEKHSAKNNIPLRVYAPSYQIDENRADYALKVMKIQFDYFEELFDMDYSLPKCDMISIPNFGTGAMENWGLITYRETNLLWDPVESSTSNKQRVAAVVSHELVHQWYGNIVTMKWWDNIWLNEGFASYFEYWGLNAAEPDWQVHDHFVIDDLQPVMGTDATVTSHPVVVPVKTPSDITSVFDSISYSKGATVLRYMRDVLGNETFIGGLRYYLKNRNFSNADEKDLFDDIQHYADDVGHDVNVSNLFNPWVLQMGFPVISVDTISGAANQQHFLIDPEADPNARPPSQYNYKWNVDLTYITNSNDTIMRQAMEIGSDLTFNFAGLNDNDWVKFNPGETGFYRVDYDDTMWETYANQLLVNHEMIIELDRSNLLDDAFNLAPAKYLTYPQALNMTRYLDTERSYFVWDAFSRGSSYIRVMLENTNIYPDFKAYFVTKVKPTADELGWNATIGSHIEKLNRYTILALALRYGDDDALNNATFFFNQWINDEDYFLYPDTRQLVYRYGVVNANVTDWELMLQRYLKETVASEKTNLLRGLTSTENVELIDRMLEYTKNESIIKSQDFFTCITYISYTPTGNRMAWTWVQLNWEYMVDRFDITDRSLGRLVPSIVSDYNTELQLWEVESFFERYPEAGAGAMGRLTAVDSIKTNIKWMTENQDIVATWLKDELNSMMS